MHQFGNGRKNRHLPHDSRPPFSLYAYIQMTFFVLGNGQFFGIETISSQKDIDKPIREEWESTCHECPFFIGYHDILQMFQLLTQHLVKAFGITSPVTIKETIFRFGTWILLQNVIHARKRIKIVIGKMVDNCFHDIADLIIR